MAFFQTLKINIAKGNIVLSQTLMQLLVPINQFAAKVSGYP